MGMLKRFCGLFGAMVFVISLASPCANAGRISGIVLAENGRAIVGAQITAIRSDGLYTETVYSNNKGHFLLDTVQKDALRIRARKLNFSDAYKDITLDERIPLSIKLELKQRESIVDISAGLTASGHFAMAQFDSVAALEHFKVVCLTCHQLGNEHTRQVRTREHWSHIVDRMLGYLQVKDDEKTQAYVDILASTFDGSPVVLDQKQPIDPIVFASHIMQWKLPGGELAHDVEFHTELEKFYTVDQAKDLIYITDPNTNSTETYEIPAGDIPVGGKFMRLFNEPNPLGLSVRRGPHSLQQGPDGKYYTTDTISGQIGVFDPKTFRYEGYDIGGKALYPHTIRFDKSGMAWFTLTISNQVGRFDPQTKEMTIIDLPNTSDYPDFPIHTPYGIDIHPKDGSVWYSRMTANHIGRIDPRTLEVMELDLPFVGPRRLRFDEAGTLWIPAFGSGSLVRLDTNTMKFTEYKLPTLSPGESEAPYAVGVHPKTQEIWITANMSDRMFRFFPLEERFISYPLPTKGIFLRDIIFTPQGWVCAASSVKLAALMIEDGMEEVICMIPDRY